MLRMVQQQHAAAVKGYYRAGYYAEGGEAAGVWGGVAAGALGLSPGGTVAWPDLNALADNQRPDGSGKWTVANVAQRRCGYDVSWHTPKSVSILYEWTLDPDILAAFRAAVDAAMVELEKEARTRVRRGQDRVHGDESRVTGNLVWATFVHRTTRPVDGTPDPHLHAHCFVFNGTHDPVEVRWKAADLSVIKAQGRYFEALFHSELAARLRALGYAIDKRPHGRWELAGIPPDVLKRFSRRTTLIEQKAEELGIVDPAMKDRLGAATRERKSREPLSPKALRELWAERLSPEEQETLSRIQRERRPKGPDLSRSLAIKAVAFALEHLLERRSVVGERTLLAEAIRWGVGWVSPADIQAVVSALEAKGALLFREGHKDFPGQRGVTTAGVLDEERRLLVMARESKGQCVPLAPHARTDPGLTAEQQRAVAHVLGTRDRVILVRGAAGTGKTTMLREVVRHIPDAVLLAPSAEASRGVLRSEGFPEADTVAAFLTRPDHFRAAGKLVVVDEAGLVGTPTLVKLLEVTKAIGARLVLVGDRRQHASVERGTALRQLETEVGLWSASVTHIQRQKGEYREAVAALSRNKVEKGFAILDGLGWVSESPRLDARLALLAASYSEFRLRGKSVLVVSPTHAEGESATAAIRRELGLGTAGLPVPRLESKGLTVAEKRNPTSYEPGDVVEFRRARWGTRRHVVEQVVDGGKRVRLDNGKLLWLDSPETFEVYKTQDLDLAAGDLVRCTRNGKTADGRHRLNNGAVYTVAALTPAMIRFTNGWTVPRDFGHLTHGYVSTSMGAQGKTVDVVLLFQGVPSRGAAGTEQFYVSASRGREECRVFTDSKAALLRAVSRSEPRTTAMDLLRRALPHRLWQAARDRLCSRRPQSTNLSA